MRRNLPFSINCQLAVRSVTGTETAVGIGLMVLQHAGRIDMCLAAGGDRLCRTDLPSVGFGRGGTARSLHIPVMEQLLLIGGVCLRTSGLVDKEGVGTPVTLTGCYTLHLNRRTALGDKLHLPVGTVVIPDRSYKTVIELALPVIRCILTAVVGHVAVINAQYGGDNYTVGLKSVSCRASVDAGGDVPALKVRLRALANVQSADAAPSAEGSANTHLVKEEVLRAAEDVIKERMASLVGFCRQNDCDLFYAKKLLYQHNYDKYVLFKEDLLSVMTEDFDIQIKSVR